MLADIHRIRYSFVSHQVPSHQWVLSGGHQCEVRTFSHIALPPLRLVTRLFPRIPCSSCSVLLLLGCLLTDQAFSQGSLYILTLGYLPLGRELMTMHTVQSSIHWQGFHHCPLGQGPLGGPW